MIAQLDTLYGTWKPTRPAKTSRRLRDAREAGHMLAGFRLDSASRDPAIQAYFSQVTNLAAGAYYDIEKRALCRARCREEFDNNAYFRRIAKVYAETVVGLGPQLAILHAGAAGEELEKLWRAWSLAVGLGEKLRLMRLAPLHSGESFAWIGDNPRPHPTAPIALDLRIIEADRVETPWELTHLAHHSPNPNDPLILDGIEIDDWDQPIAYYVAKVHPTDTPRQDWRQFTQFNRIDAADMVHLFDRTRPEQRRGIPEMQSALILLRVMREFTLAVCEAGVNLAKQTIYFETDIPPDALAGEGDEEDGPPPNLPNELPTVPITRGRGQFLPENWKASAVKAEQPTATYDMFTGALIAEIGASIGMPENLARGSSKNFNFASGRLDHLTFRRTCDIDRERLERLVLEPLLARFLTDLAETGQLPAGLPTLAAELDHAWHWQAVDNGGDPAKEQAAATERIRAGLSSIQDEAAALGNTMARNIAETAEALGKSEQEVADAIFSALWGAPPEPPEPPEAPPETPPEVPPEAPDPEDEPEAEAEPREDSDE